MSALTFFLDPYILQQDKESMIYKVFKATCENPTKNDFVKKYFDCLDLRLTFEEIGAMSTYKFKQLVKQKTEQSGFSYLIKENKHEK